MNINVDLSNPADRKMLGKLRRGEPVQVKPIHFDSSRGTPVKVEIKNDMLKKMMKAKKIGKGVRISLSPDEAKMMGEGLNFTKTGRLSRKKLILIPTKYKRFVSKAKMLQELQDKRDKGLLKDDEEDEEDEDDDDEEMKEIEGGRIKKPKSLKQLNRETKRAFSKAGETLKKVPKLYRENVREYTSPVFKSLLTEGVPSLAEAGVVEALKSRGVPAPVAKVAGKAVKAGLKKPMTMGYKKSGLGVHDGMGVHYGNGVHYGMGAPIPTRTTGKGMCMGRGMCMCPMCKNMGMGMKVHSTDMGTHSKMIMERPQTLTSGGMIFNNKLINTTSKQYQPNTTAEAYSTPINLSGLRIGGSGLGSGLFTGRN